MRLIQKIEFQISLLTHIYPSKIIPRTGYYKVFDLISNSQIIIKHDNYFTDHYERQDPNSKIFEIDSFYVLRGSEHFEFNDISEDNKQFKITSNVYCFDSYLTPIEQIDLFNRYPEYSL